MTRTRMMTALFGLLAFGWLVLAQPISASSIQPTPMPPATAATPAPGETPTPTVTATPSPTITENIFHIISFPFQAMTDAVVNMSNKIIGEAYKDAEWIYGDTLNQIIFGDYGIAPNALGSDSTSTPLFAHIIQPHWNVMLSLALLFLPATLALTAVSALRSGVTSVLGYADLKEALLGWVIGAGAAVASYYLLGLAHRLSLAVAQSILLADFGERVSGQSLALAFFNSAAVSALASLIPGAPVALLYIGFFALFLASSIILGIALALAAYTALVYLLSAIAPIVITLGVLPPLRWLHALWLKAVTLTFLLPVADALLLKASVSLVRSFYDPNGVGASLGSFLSGLFITAGVLSVLIAINFKVGETVFGALGEIHRQAQGATVGVIQLATAALGFVAGGIGIAAGGAGLTGSSAGAATMAGGSGPVGDGATTASMGETIQGSTSQAPTTTPTTGGSTGGATTSLRADPASLARRTANLLTSRLNPTSAASPDGDEHSPSASTSATTNDPATNPQDSDGPVSGDDADKSEQASAGDGVSHSGAASNPDEQMRRSRLAEGLGRALRTASNPIAQSLGTGLQLSGALGTYTASGALNGSRSAQNTDAPVSASDRQEQRLLDSAMLWSGRDLSNTPNDLFDVGRDNTSLMAGALHQSFLNDSSNGRATDMRTVLPVVRQSYGQWQAQDRPGGVEAQRGYFEAVANPDNTTSAGRLIGALNQWAGDNQVQLPAELPQTVQAVFDKSQSV